MSYKHQKNLQGNIGETILRKADNALIPMVVGNRDYDEYLEWLKIDGNVTEEAD